LGVIFATAVIMMVLTWLYKVASHSGFDNLLFYVIAGTFMLLFAIFNSIISLAVNNMNNYWSRSIPCFAILMIVLGFLAYLFSSVSIFEAGTFAWIFQVLTFGYLLFLSMMRFMRKIVQLAQREDNRWMNRRK
jgi:chromate transport protein ChrA